MRPGARNLITDVHNIDARGSGANTLTIDRAAIASLSGVANELHVMSNLDDTVQFGDGWTLTGTMVADGRSHLLNAWWLSTFPGLAIVFTVLAFNLVGDGLRDALDPRLRT